MAEHAVVIAGGGPTGMMLAAELALAQVDVAIVERRPDAVLAGSRAGGLHSRTIEVLDQRGVADRFLAEGQVVQAARIRHGRAGHERFPDPSSVLPRDLAEPHRADHGRVDLPNCRCASITAREVTGFAQDDAGVDVVLAEGRPLRAQYLVGCDGGRSVIRRAAGIGFPGWDRDQEAT